MERSKDGVLVSKDGVVGSVASPETNVRALFGNGEGGAWFDSGDMSTLFQDEAGTTPVTAPGQPVGKMLDKSGNENHATWSVATGRPTYAGQVVGVGPEKLTNGTFDADENWSKGAGWSIADGKATITGGVTAFMTQAVSVTAGKLYRVEFTVSDRSGGTLTPQFTGGTTSAGAAVNANGSYSILLRAEAGNTTFALRGGSATLSVDEVSLKEVTEWGGPFGLYGDGVSQILATPYTPTEDWSAAIAFKKLNSPATFLFESYESAASAYFTTTPTIQTFGAPANQANIVYNVYTNRDYVWSNAVTGDNVGTVPLTLLGRYNGAAASALTNGYFYGGVFRNGALDGADVNLLEQYLWWRIGLGRAFAAWGDSFTSGAGATGQGAWPSVLASNLGCGYFNGGIGGQTSTQIKDRYLADVTGKKHIVNIFWIGRNNLDAPATIKADIAACVANTSSGKYLVLGVLNGATEPNSTQEYDDIEQLNSELASTYGARFVDVKAYLLTKGDGGEADNQNIADGIVPASLRSDGLHLNDAGYGHVADLLAAKIAEMGW